MNNGILYWKDKLFRIVMINHNLAILYLDIPIRLHDKSKLRDSRSEIINAVRKIVDRLIHKMIDDYFDKDMTGKQFKEPVKHNIKYTISPGGEWITCSLTKHIHALSYKLWEEEAKKQEISTRLNVTTY